MNIGVKISVKILNKLLYVIFLSILIIASYSPKSFSDEKINNYKTQGHVNHKTVSNNLFFEKKIIINGMKRSYYVSLPLNYNPQKSYPVLFVFHGGLRNALNILEITGLRNYQKEYDFIIIAPNGLGWLNNETFLTWDAGNCSGYAHYLHADDPLFVKSIIEQVSDLYNIDKKRIYLTGMSNGAMLCYKLVRTLPGLFAGIAPVSGALNRDQIPPYKPIPVIIFHGTADLRILYEGGIPRDFWEEKHRVDKPVSYAVNFWVKNNKCDPNPTKTKKGHVEITKYTNCENNADVILYKIIGGKHAWPGGKRDSIIGDRVSKEINASKIIIDTFIKNN